MPGEDEEQRRADELHQIAEDEDSGPLEPVRGLAGHQDQHDEGEELGQADEAELQRVARESVDLPPHRNGLHLDGHRRKEAGAQEESERALSDQCPETGDLARRGCFRQRGWPCNGKRGRDYPKQERRACHSAR